MKVCILILSIFSIQQIFASMAYIPGYTYDLNEVHKNAKICFDKGHDELIELYGILTLHKSLAELKKLRIESHNKKLHPMDLTNCEVLSSFPKHKIINNIESQVIKLNKWNLKLSKELKPLFEEDSKFLGSFLLNSSTIYSAWITKLSGTEEEAINNLKKIFESEEKSHLKRKELHFFMDTKASFLARSINRLEFIEKVIGKKFPKENFKARIKKVKIYLSNLPSSQKVT